MKSQRLSVREEKVAVKAAAYEQLYGPPVEEDAHDDLDGLSVQQLRAVVRLFAQSRCYVRDCATPCEFQASRVSGCA